MLCEEGRAALGGIERADSVALDPHKTLFLPYGTGAVVVREGRKLFDAFSASADYIQPVRRERCRPVAGRPLARADPPFPRAAALAAAAARRRRRLPRRPVGEDRPRPLFPRAPLGMPGWDAGPPPDLSVVAFRYRPGQAMPTPSTTRLLQRASRQEGRVFLSGTRIDGETWLRCAILSFRTHLAHIDEIIDVLARTAAALQSE